MRREFPPGWRVIEHAGNEIDARLIAGHLQDAGIRVVLERDNSGYGDYLYGGANPNAPVILLVPEEQWQAATAVLDNAAVDVAGSGDPRETEEDDVDADHGNVDEEDLSSASDDFYLREDPAEDPVLAAPARAGLRWVLIALVILVVVIAAVEGGFFSDLVGV